MVIYVDGSFFEVFIEVVRKYERVTYSNSSSKRIRRRPENDRVEKIKIRSKRFIRNKRSYLNKTFFQKYSITNYQLSFSIRSK